MKITIFGATGPTGRLLLSQALAQGHHATAFARRPGSLQARQNLRILQGDTTRDAAAVEEAVRGQDAVISALGVSASFFPNGLMERSVANILPAMERSGVKRLIVMSAFGVGESKNDAPPLPRLMYCTLLSAIFADKLAAEEKVRAASLDWTIVYPTLLTHGAMTGHYRVGERLGLSGLPSISRANVAHFMLGELTQRRFVRKVVALSD